MKRREVDMLHGPLAGSILIYSVPIIFTGILQLLFNTADLIVVGRFCGSLSVAAVGSTGAIINLIVNLFIGLSVGAGVAVSHAIGGREDDVVHRTVHTAMPLAVLTGIVLTVIGIGTSTGMLRMMETPDSVIGLADVYLKIFFTGMTFNMLLNFCASILRAAGDTRSPLVALTIAGVLNVVLNIIFVTAFSMNVAGVALATVISQAFSALALVWVLIRRQDACHLDLRQIRFYRPQLMKMIRIGLPAGIQSSMFSISNVIIQSSINSFGDVLMSANAAAASIEGFNNVTINAFHQTGLNYVGQNMGAHQYDRIKRIMGLCMAYVVAAALAMGCVVCYFAPPLLSLYIPDSPEAIALGAQRLLFTSLPYFILGMMDVMNGVLRGLGASLVSMLISVLGICGLRLVWIFTVFRMPRFHTPGWLYSSYPISWGITLVVQLIVFSHVYTKLRAEAET